MENESKRDYIGKNIVYKNSTVIKIKIYIKHNSKLGMYDLIFNS